MNARSRRFLATAGVLATAGGMAAGVVLGVGGRASTAAATGGSGEIVRLKDARLKFEINATDHDAGVQLFLDADEWRELSVFDPLGRRILTTTARGRMARQGGTELFLESAEPSFEELSIARLKRRWPKGRYAIRGLGTGGERISGSAILSHRIPRGPGLVAPLPANGPQPPDDTTIVWERIPPPAGGAIVGYQVLVVRSETGSRALPTVTLDVTMPPTASRMKVPPGFLRRGTEYEWEVLAIERGGNQTLSSSTFTTTR